MKKIPASKTCKKYIGLLLLLTEVRRNAKVKTSKKNINHQPMSQILFSQALGIKSFGTIAHIECGNVALDFAIYDKYMSSDIVNIEDKKKIMNYITKHYPEFLCFSNQVQYLKNGKYKDFLQTLFNNHYFCNKENISYKDIIEEVLFYNNAITKN